MKILLAQQNYRIGDFESNLKKMRRAIEEGRRAKAELVVFSEMSICGYPARDFLYFDDFIDQCNETLEALRKESGDIAIIAGAPQRNPVKEGKDLFNAAYFLYREEIVATIQKTCLPTYDVFDEDRYFEQADEWNVIHFKDKKIALTICEDIWNMGDNPLYRSCPMDMLMPQQPDIMINISASPFDYTHSEGRRATIKQNVLKYKIPLVYCNAVGSQTEIVFDGDSLVFDKRGNLCIQLPQFAEALKAVEIRDDGSVDADVIEPAAAMAVQLTAPKQLVQDFQIASVHNAIVLGIRDYFSKMNFSKAIVGNSGGIDSAVTLALAATALGRKNVKAVMMPSNFSSSHSIADAKQLCNTLEIENEMISIMPVFEAFLEQLKPAFAETPFGLAEENIQARIRGALLMAIANKYFYILLNTSNKSELSVGYGTLYGDMAGGLAVLGDCYKLQVYELAKYINREKEIIPINILKKPPSAELRPEQKDSDSLPPYEMLDPILYQYIERAQSPFRIKAAGFEPALVDRIIALVNKNEYKRNQFCPVIRISPKSFGPGRRMPIVAKYLY